MNELLLILRALEILAAGLRAAPGAINALAELSAKVGAMVAEDRNPTPAEWADLFAHADARHAAIQALARETRNPPA